MSGFLNTTFGMEEKKVSEPTNKKIVYVSKTPEAAVNAAGVVAGTSGMVGGAVLGGMVGVSKLPGEYIKQVAGQNYSKIAQNAFDKFKEALINSPELMTFVNAIKEAKSPEITEEIIEIANTISARLHNTFETDVHASAVIDKVVDPFIESISVKKNFRSYGSGLRSKIESPIGQTILKFIGFNRKTSKIAKHITGNIAEGIAKSIENLRNLTPEEQEAWKKVSKQIVSEFEHNPKIKFSKDIAKAISGMVKNIDWITSPFKNMQQSIIDATNDLNISLGKAPIKTIGKYSCIGAITCAILSMLGWYSMKKGLMKKEIEKNREIQS